MRASQAAGLVAAAAGAGWGAFAALPREQRLAEFATPLAGRTPNQRSNAERALAALQGQTVGPGATFSFNRTVGSFSEDRGYRKAPVSYNGQLIVTFGGGVCQTSTTLYNAALLAGLDIVERNRHRFAPSYAPPGRDAAVAYDSVDLRIRNPYRVPVRIRGRIAGDWLALEIVGACRPAKVSLESKVLSSQRARTMAVPAEEGKRFVRNSGKDGFEVRVDRIVDGRREVVSHDTYEVMHRLLASG